MNSPTFHGYIHVQITDMESQGTQFITGKTISMYINHAALCDVYVCETLVSNKQYDRFNQGILINRSAFNFVFEDACILLFILLRFNLLVIA